MITGLVRAVAHHFAVGPATIARAERSATPMAVRLWRGMCAVLGQLAMRSCVEMGQVGIAMLIAARVALAAAPLLTEAQVKAGFLYNFAMFVVWPDDGDHGNPQRVIGIVGSSPVGDVLTKMDGRPANGRSLIVKRLADSDEARHCDILFIATSNDRDASLVLGRVRDVPVLTVGESPRFTHIGGIVRLYLEDDQVRFEVNVEEAARARIRISSKVLSLARLTKDGE